MPRKQFWALRDDLTWYETDAKSTWPTEAIQRRWGAACEDLVFFNSLAPTPFQRSPEARWSQRYEVVGLGGDTKTVKLLFSRLRDEANREKERRELLKRDPNALIQAKIEEERKDYAGTRESVVKEINTNGMITALTRSWGESVPRLVRAQTKAELYGAIETRAKNKGISLFQAMEEEIATVIQTIGRPRSHYEDRFTPGEVFANFYAIAGQHEFMDSVRRLQERVRAIRDAHEMEAKIVAFRGLPPEQHPPEDFEAGVPKIERGPPRNRRVRCCLCQRLLEKVNARLAGTVGRKRNYHCARCQAQVEHAKVAKTGTE